MIVSLAGLAILLLVFLLGAGGGVAAAAAAADPKMQIYTFCFVCFALQKSFNSFKKQESQRDTL